MPPVVVLQYRTHHKFCAFGLRISCDHSSHLLFRPLPTPLCHPSCFVFILNQPGFLFPGSFVVEFLGTSNLPGRLNLANRFPVVGTFVWNRYTVTAPVFRYPGRLFVGVWNGQVSTVFYTPPELQQQIYKPGPLFATNFRLSRNCSNGSLVFNRFSIVEELQQSIRSIKFG